ncbi:MAG: molybdopterin cofactor-binding domain-containing protein [Phenylobacterium sp.]|nr:molybdopterin cofactor-binding domain-containing protein [Phenylobacterium sp.]
MSETATTSRSTVRAMSRRDLLGLGGAALAGAWAPATFAAGVDAQAGSDLVSFYLSIGADDLVTMQIPATEIGQGVTTSLAQIIAEEMDADWSQVRFVLAGAGEAYANPGKGFQGVGRSMSVRGYWPLLRRIGATARQRLVTAAAARWSVPADQVVVAKGVLRHPPSGRTLSFGALAQDAARTPMPGKVVLKDPSTFQIIGASPQRLDIPEKVDGTAIYGIDVKLPGMLNVAVLTAPAVGGKLGRYNAEAVKASPGVRLVVETQQGLSPGLAVCADTWWQASKALQSAQPTWVASPHADMNTDSLARDRLVALDGPGMTVIETEGGVADALAGEGVLQGDYHVPYLAHGCMEPMTAVVDVRPDRCELWVGAQGQVRVRDAVAALLNLPKDKVTVNTVMAGGGFGRRHQIDYVLQAVEIAQAAGRPVKLIWSREEDMMHDWYRPAVSMRYRAKLGAAGELAALEIKLAGDSLLEWGKPRPAAPKLDATSASGISDQPYAIPAFRAASTTVATPVPVGMWRSVGHSQNTFFMEGVMDELAVAARADPLVYRRRLLAAHPRFIAVLDRVSALSGWGTAKAKGVGRGVAICEGYGSIVAQVVEIEVLSDSEIKIRRISCVIDCGRAVSPDGVKAQMEGGIIYGLSAALTGDVTFENGEPQVRRFSENMPVTLSQTPEILVEILESDAPIGGAGEPGTPCIAPALLNAYHDATGQRLRTLPLARAGVLAV